MRRYGYLKKQAMVLLESLVDFTYPGYCPVCGKRTDVMPLCTNCADRFISSFSVLQFSEKDDFSHIKDNLYFSGCFCGWDYTEDIRNLISMMKYRGFESICIFIGRILGREFKNIFFQHDLIVPVPLHPVKKRERMYNQSELIAEGILQEVSNIKMRTLLRRTRYTKPQSTLNGEERQTNVRDAFVIKKYGSNHKKSAVLVDDIITTGATVNNCAKVLHENGIENVRCISIARPVTVK